MSTSEDTGPKRGERLKRGTGTNKDAGFQREWIMRYHLVGEENKTC